MQFDELHRGFHGAFLVRGRGEAEVGRVDGVTVRGDVDTPYKCIGGAIFQMQQAGFAKVGFISEPAPGGTTIRQ